MLHGFTGSQASFARLAVPPSAVALCVWSGSEVPAPSSTPTPYVYPCVPLADCPGGGV